MPLSSTPQAVRYIEGTATVDIDELASQYAEVEYYPLRGNVDGAVYPSRGRWVILINDIQPRVRQRFTLAHEVAHRVLHLDAIPGPMFCQVHSAAGPLERQADRWASQVLMPAKLVRAITSQSIWTSRTLAGTFGVSQQAMEIRLRELGVR